MSPEHDRVDTEAAAAYEHVFVPALFGVWTGLVADAAGVRAGDRPVPGPTSPWRPREPMSC